MRLKKINAVISLSAALMYGLVLPVVSLVLLGVQSLWGIGSGLILVLSVILSCHVVLCVCVFFFNHEMGGGTFYAWRNWRIVIQRGAVLFMVILFLLLRAFCPWGEFGQGWRFLFLHVAGGLMVLFSCAHAGVSVPRALLSLGLAGNEKSYRLAEKVSFAVFGTLAILTVIAIVSHLFLAWGV